ncbi:MAG: hypothetical protein WAT92_00675 [Saprospiraceae bacterium]
MKSNHLSILFFLCLFAPTATTFLLLSHQKIQIKKEVKEHIDSEKDTERLVLLKFTEQEKQEELEWEHAAEFEYQNQMYDVVKSEVHGDTTFYWCWHDIEETEINQQLKALICLSFDDRPEKDGFLQKFQNLYKSFYHSNGKLPFKNIPTQNQGIWDYTQHIQTINSLDPDSPPPKFG